MLFWKRNLRCSFCGRGEADVRKLVAGPRVHICDRCVAIARDLMEDNPDAAPPFPAPSSSFVQRVRKAARRKRTGFQRAMDIDLSFVVRRSSTQGARRAGDAEILASC